MANNNLFLLLIFSTLSNCLATEFCSPGNVRCTKSTKCVLESQLCDGIIDCEDSSDEINCLIEDGDRNQDKDGDLNQDKDHNHLIYLKDFKITAIHPFLHKSFINAFLTQYKKVKASESGTLSRSSYGNKCNPRGGKSECGPCATCSCNSGVMVLREDCTCTVTPLDKLINLFKDEC